MRLAASEKAGHSCEKAPARWLSAGCSISLGNLFLQSADSTLCIGHSLLHHEKALNQHVRSRRNLSDLAPDQLISFGIFALAAGLAEPIEQTGYEITFFGCHSLKKTLFSTLTSSETVPVPVSGETCRRVGVRSQSCPLSVFDRRRMKRDRRKKGDDVHEDTTIRRYAHTFPPTPPRSCTCPGRRIRRRS